MFPGETHEVEKCSLGAVYVQVRLLIFLSPEKPSTTPNSSHGMSRGGGQASVLSSVVFCKAGSDLPVKFLSFNRGKLLTQPSSGRERRVGSGVRFENSVHTGYLQKRHGIFRRQPWMTHATFQKAKSTATFPSEADG